MIDFVVAGMHASHRLLVCTARLTHYCYSSRFPLGLEVQNFSSANVPPNPSKSKYANLLDITRSPADILRNLSPEDHQRKKDLEMRITCLPMIYMEMPTVEMLTDEHWVELLSMESEEARLKFLRFVFLTHTNDKQESMKSTTYEQMNPKLMKSKESERMKPKLMNPKSMKSKNSGKLGRSAEHARSSNQSRLRLPNKSKYAHLLDATRSPSDILQNLSPEDQQRLKDLQTSVPYLTAMYTEMPTLEMLKDRDWLKLLTIEPMKSRLDYLRSVFLLHAKRECESQKRKERRQRNFELRKTRTFVGDPFMNSIILENIDNTKMAAFYNRALLHAFLFNLPLIIDMDFLDLMSQREQKYVCNQIRDIHASNRISPEPFHLHFTGLDSKSLMYSNMSKFFIHKWTYEISEGDDKMEDKIPYTFTDKCFTEIFPKEKLVYLTPHTDRQLAEFDPNDIYVIGAFNDLDKSGYPAALLKSRKLGIRMRSLPLDKEFRYWRGEKYVGIKQVFNIMSSLFLTGSDWKEAMKFIPTHFRSPEAHTDNTESKRRRKIDQIDF